MRAGACILALALGGSLVACVDASDVVDPSDVVDGGGVDIGGADGAFEAGPPDGRPDGPAVDGAPPDAGMRDAAPPDLDMALADGMPPDRGMAPFDDAEPIDVAPADMAPDAAPPPDCPTLTTGDETRAVGPCHVCRAPGQIPPGFEGWAVAHVDPAAAPGGDGSAERPYAALADAAAGLEAPTVLLLADGDHAGPVRLTTSAALIGACAERVRITGGDGDTVTARGERVVLDGVTVHGGDRGVVGEGAILELRRAVVRQAAVGVAGEGVGTVAVVDSHIHSAVRAHVRITDSGAAVIRSIIGPGFGVGIDAASHGPAVPCGESSSPVCPYRAGLYVTDSRIAEVGGLGVGVRNGRAHVRRSVIEEVDSGDAPEPVGVWGRQSFVIIDGQTAVRRVAATDVDDLSGVAVRLDSSRGHVGDVELTDCGRGGLVVGRLAPEGLVPFAEGGLEPPGVWFPGEAWSPRPDLFVGDGFGPPADWFPGEAWAPQPDALPFQLRPDTVAIHRSPELGLFRWARVEVGAARIGGHPGFGLDLAGHAVRLDGVSVRDIGGAAVAVTRRSELPVDVPGGDVVALSELRGVSVDGTGGGGLSVTGAALICGVGGDPDAPCSVPAEGVEQRVAVPVSLGRHLVVSGGIIRETGGIGVTLFDSVVTMERVSLEGIQGIGIWSYGSRIALRSNDIRDIRFHNLRGRFDQVDVADGMIVEGRDTPLAQSAEIRSNIVIGARRVGMLLVVDRVELPFDLALGEGRLAENGADVVVIGDVGRNPQGAVEGFDVQEGDARRIPPPCGDCGEEPVP